MILSFSKMNFQKNRIFNYYTVEMYFWKKYFFIPNINEIYVINIDNSTTINDVHLSNVESYVIIGYNEDDDED